MFASAPLATIPVSFFDPQTGLSALALQHVRVEGRTTLVYHDAPAVAAARPLLGAIATALMAELREGQTLSLIESSIPEHPAEPFIYAQVALSSAPCPGRVNAGMGRVIGPDDVARACGIDVREVERTQELVLDGHRPRACAFPGFRQLALGDRTRDGLAAA